MTRSVLTPPFFVCVYVHRGPGEGNESRGLTKACDILLPHDKSRFFISDVISCWEERMMGKMYSCFDQEDLPDPCYPPILTCVGDGYYPVYVSKDQHGVVKKSTVLFRLTRILPSRTNADADLKGVWREGWYWSLSREREG